MAKTDRLADFLASESKDASSVTMDELLVKAEDMTLADHDKIHHPEGYKEGDECKLRDNFKAANAGEELTDPNAEIHADTQVSSEARHSTNLPFGKWLNGELEDHKLEPQQKYELQSKFQRAVQDATDGLFDDVAKIIDPSLGEGLLKATQQNLVGYYEKTGTDGLQEEIMFKMDGEGANQSVPESVKTALDTYCCLIGLLRKQDGVSWNTPMYNADTDAMNGIEYNIGRAINKDEYDDLVEYLDKTIGEKEALYSFSEKEKSWTEYKKLNNLIADGHLGLISTANGVRIIDFCGKFVDNTQMQSILSSALDDYDKLKGKTRGFRSEGSYLDSKITEKDEKGEDKYVSTWFDKSPDNGYRYFEMLKEKVTDPQKLQQIRALYEKYAPIVDEAEGKAAKEIGYKSELEKSPNWR